MRAVWRDKVRMLLRAKIAGNDVAVTVLTGQDKVGTRSPEMPSEHELRIGYVDPVRMRCVNVKNGRVAPVAALN